MLNRNSSARTAAKKSSKCSLLILQAPILAILMLAAGLSSCETKKAEGVSSDIKYSSWACQVKVLEVDSCQYILAQTGTSDGGLAIVHKQNCKYCLTRKK